MNADSGPGERPSRLIRVLIIPAHAPLACQVAYVEYRAAALSDAIGGGLLADIYYGCLLHHSRAGNDDVGTRDEGGRFCFYADEDRVAKRLPGNPRAAVLAARLACIGALHNVSLAGDILIAGATITNDDTDVPDEVIAAAWRGGLLPTDPAVCRT